MDDVDFVPTSQCEKGKDVMKDGLTSVFKLSLIEHIPFRLRIKYMIHNLIPCQPHFSGDKD